MHEKDRANDLRGIVNGIDYDEYDPMTDKFIVKQYLAYRQGYETCTTA